MTTTRHDTEIKLSDVIARCNEERLTQLYNEKEPEKQADAACIVLGTTLSALKEIETEKDRLALVKGLYKPAMIACRVDKHQNDAESAQAAELAAESLVFSRGFLDGFIKIGCPDEPLVAANLKDLFNAVKERAEKYYRKYNAKTKIDAAWEEMKFCETYEQRRDIALKSFPFLYLNEEERPLFITNFIAMTSDNQLKTLDNLRCHGIDNFHDILFALELRLKSGIDENGKIAIAIASVENEISEPNEFLKLHAKNSARNRHEEKVKIKERTERYQKFSSMKPQILEKMEKTPFSHLPSNEEKKKFIYELIMFWEREEIGQILNWQLGHGIQNLEEIYHCLDDLSAIYGRVWGEENGLTRVIEIASPMVKTARQNAQMLQEVDAQSDNGVKIADKKQNASCLDDKKSDSDMDNIKSLVNLEPNIQEKIKIYEKYRKPGVVKTYKNSGLWPIGRTPAQIEIDQEISTLKKIDTTAPKPFDGSVASMIEYQRLVTQPHPDEIIKNIFLGHGNSGDEWLKTLSEDNSNNSKCAIVRCIPDKPIIKDEKVLDRLQSNKNLMIVPVGDKASENLCVHFDACCDFIDNALKNGKKILIHCNAGASRSPTFTAAYLIRRYGLSVDDALNHITNKRRIVSIRDEFKKQLADYAKYLQTQNQAKGNKVGHYGAGLR